MLRARDRSARQHALSQAARLQSYESGRDAVVEASRSGATLLRAEVTQVLPGSKVRIRRETSVNPDGTFGDEDPFDYPIAAGGTPSVGDWIFGIESAGKPIFFGGAGGFSSDGSGGLAPNLFTATKEIDQSITDRAVGGYQRATWDNFTPVEGIFVNSANRIVFSQPGAYICMLTKISWAENYAGIRRARILHNGAAIVYGTGFPGTDGVGWTTTATGINAEVNDTLSLEVLQSSGGALALDFAEVRIFKISGPPGAKGDPGGPGGQGAPGINWRNDVSGGLWSNAANYLKDDGVRYAGSSWRALRPNINVQPVEGQDWAYIAQKGDKGDPGAKGDKGDRGPGGESVHYGQTPPPEPHSYILWVDTSTSPSRIKEWDGTTWNETGSAGGNFASSKSPFVNLMPDSGRFTAKMNPLDLTFATAFQNTNFLNPYNATSVASGGKFIHNNTTNGGPAGKALTQDVQDLLIAMGRDPNTALSQYGVEWFVATYTMGGGTGLSSIGPDGIERHEMTTNGSKAMFGFDSICTNVMWMRIKSASASSGGAFFLPQLTSKDGGDAGDGLVRVSDGWTHVRHVVSSPLGYINTYPAIRARAGDVIQIALPAFFAGPVDPGIHTAPLVNVNELMG